MGNANTLKDLQMLQALPLSVKIKKTEQRIKEWVDEYGEDGVYVSFSGGKDSTVLLHIARSLYPNIKAVHVNTGLEFPEIERFVKTFENVDIIRPKMSFVQVIKKYGYPIFSKEVSECVYGARKYLTSLLESGSLDRPTDRPTDLPYRYWYERVTGTGAYQKHQTRSPSSVSIRDRQNSWNVQTCQVPSGIQGGMTTSGVKLEKLANTLNERMLNKMGGQNQRLAIMLGMLTNDKSHPIKANIPKNDRSMFSQERYSFLLDAPFEISNMCCNVMKKEPAHRYQKEIGRNPITAQMASESRLRTQKWLQNGCNGFNLKRPMSNPMSFWTEQDVLLYIHLHNIPIASVYGDVVKDGGVDGQMDLADFGIFDLERPLLKTTGMNRTGCFACGYGIHHECSQHESRIQSIIDYSNPKFADWMLRGGCFNEKGLWIPKGGLGLWFVFIWIRKYGNFKIWFPNEKYYMDKYSTPETEKYLKD